MLGKNSRRILEIIYSDSKKIKKLLQFSTMMYFLEWQEIKITVLKIKSKMNKFLYNKKLLKFLVKALGSLFFIWWVVFKVNWLEVWSYLQKVTLWQLSLYIVCYLVGMIFSAYKWKFLARHKEINLPLTTFFKSYFTATFINNFMPSFVGGDSFKIYQIGRQVKKYKEIASSVIMDRLTGLWGAMILALIFAIFNFSSIVQNKVLIGVNLVILGGLIFWFLLLEFFRQRKIKTSVKKVDKMLNMIINEVNRYNGRNNEIWKAVLLSFPFNFIGLAGANYILFLSMGIDIGGFNYLSVIFLISIVSSIPVTVNNIGIKEWAYISFFGFFGASPSAVISVAIISRTIQMVLSFFALPVYLKERKNR